MKHWMEKTHLSSFLKYIILEKIKGPQMQQIYTWSTGATSLTIEGREGAFWFEGVELTPQTLTNEFIHSMVTPP